VPSASFVDVCCEVAGVEVRALLTGRQSALAFDDVAALRIISIGCDTVAVST